MTDDLIYRCNVKFELYKAALNREISQDEFTKVLKIIERAKTVEEYGISLSKAEKAFNEFGERAREAGRIIDNLGQQLKEQNDEIEREEGGYNHDPA